MDWRDALFAHWPADPAVVADRLPPGIEVRTHCGDAYLGVVAFVLTAIRPRGVPRPLSLTFGEVNLRTYVRGPDGGEGIYFFNLDAADPIGVGVARRLYGLPYYRATMTLDRRTVGEGGTGRPGTFDEERVVDFVSNRIHPGAPEAHFDGRYRPVGDAFEPEAGSLASFLVENYRFYVAGDDVDEAGNGADGARDEAGDGADRARDEAGDGVNSEMGDAGDGTGEEVHGAGDAVGDAPAADDAPSLFYGDVEHPPWPVYEADLDLRSTSLFETNGFESPDGDPLVHYSPGVAVTADRVRRVD